MAIRSFYRLLFQSYHSSIQTLRFAGLHCTDMPSFNPIIVRFKLCSKCPRFCRKVCFQSYHSSIQTVNAARDYFGLAFFQSYHSSIQTAILEIERPMMVGFQSYHSSIQTNHVGYAYWIDTAFQSYHSSIQTPNAYNNNSRQTSFNPIIVRFKPCHRDRSYRRQYRLSILS